MKPILLGLCVTAIAAAQSVGGCSLLPANNVWNTPIDSLPVHPNSAAFVTTIGPAKYLHPDFSATGYGIPFITVPATQPKVPVSFQYADESDPGPYPVPANAPIEGGASSTGDRHVLVVETGNCILYELYAAYPQPDGSWKAGSGAVFDLKSNALRPAGWTSADAAGLPVLPGLVRYDEVAAGEIRHALRMTAPQTKREYIWPARHYASSLTGTQYPPMGLRFRLKASFDITPYPADVQVILRALKKYGAILADNGSSWYLTGAPDPRWNDDSLRTLRQVLGSNLEAVDESGLMVDPNSGATSTVLALSSVSLNPAQMAGGTSSAQHSVVLTGPAPAGGASVALSTSNSAAATVPAAVVVPAGATSATFTISTSPVASSTAVTIAAFYLGVTKSATLTIAPASLTALAISPASVTGGAASTATITLTGPAPAGGAAIAVASSDPAASVPGTVTVPAGASSASFAISTVAVTATRAASISASYAGVIRSASLTINPPAPTTTYTLQAPATANRRQTVVVQWTAPAGHAGNDSIDLYGDGRVWWTRTTGSGTSGTFSVRLPNRAGQYVFRLVRAGGTVAAQTAITVR